MNLKQANYIRTIVREGSISAAARKLFVSQPSLSQMVRQVEAEYGVALFDRSVSPLRLTFAGERYLEAANQILTANERMENELTEIRQENSGLLRLGLSVQRGMQVLPESIEPMAIFVQPPGAFLVLAVIIAVMNAIGIKSRQRKLVESGCDGQCAGCAMACDKKEKEASAR